MMNIILSNYRYRKASVLVLVLIVLSSMIILSVGFAYRTYMEMQQVYSNSRRVKAYYLALGGIERIRALFKGQQLSPDIIAGICHFNSDIEEERLFEHVEGYISGEEKKVLSYCIKDELSFFNLNISDPACWINIDGISDGLCSCILDWTDEDSNISYGGAESSYYESTEISYSAKNAPMTALREILFLSDMNYQLYVGEDMDRDNTLDENERDGFLNLPFDNENGFLDKGMVDIFTVYGDGKININTVDSFILSALSGFDSRTAELVLSNRAGPDNRFGTDDDIFYTNSGDIAGIKGLTDLEISLLQEYCCFETEYFRVFSSAGLKGYPSCCLMATIKVEGTEPEILYIERLL